MNILVNSFKHPLLVLVIGTAMLLGSCSPKRNLTYFSDLGPGKEMDLANDNYTPLIIQEGDQLEIKVITVNPESNVLFNYGIIPNNNNEINFDAVGSYNLSKYLVASDGTIDFPILGKVKLLGLSKEEARLKMVEELSKLVTDPKVEMSIINFKVTVIGEVNNPSTFQVNADRITVLEALGLAGDMTVYGKRENVLLIRETVQGKQLFRIDMNNKNVLNSSNYYLKQNDVLYVEADKKKQVQSDINPTTIAVLSIVSSIAVAFIFNFQEIFR